MGAILKTSILTLGIFVLLATLGQSEPMEDEVPMTKLTQNMGAPTLKFFYW